MPYCILNTSLGDVKNQNRHIEINGSHGLKHRLDSKVPKEFVKVMVICLVRMQSCLQIRDVSLYAYLTLNLRNNAHNLP